MSGLIPAALLTRLPKLYACESQKDPVAQVKLFTPWAGWTWYLLEYDPVEKLGFAWVEGVEAELGYVSLGELEGLRGPGGPRVECDLLFQPTPLSKIRRADQPARMPQRERER
ncbi:MAG TPA: DUF2958 domain-containing protein [Phycisphaerales bacterium]|nr:DUF2958 domain-containing protein [Phycisphaerales bacterium]